MQLILVPVLVPYWSDRIQRIRILAGSVTSLVCLPQNLVPAYSGLPGKWPWNERRRRISSGKNPPVTTFKSDFPENASIFRNVSDIHLLNVISRPFPLSLSLSISLCVPVSVSLSVSQLSFSLPIFLATMSPHMLSQKTLWNSWPFALLDVMSYLPHTWCLMGLLRSTNTSHWRQQQQQK